MATLNLNSVLCNASVGDVVAIDRMGIGSQRAGLQPTASLSLGWPKPIGPRPTNAPMLEALAMQKCYRDATRERTGRSEFSPSAGFLVLPCFGSDSTSRAALFTRGHCFAATATEPTRQARRSLSGIGRTVA